MKRGKSRNIFFVGFLVQILLFLIVSSAHAADFNVDMGNADPPCGSFATGDSGFVDCQSNTGGLNVTAITTIHVGDTVSWTMRATPHTATSNSATQAAPASGA